jgi:hypothetical protein
MIRGIYDFARNNDGENHYDPTKSIDKQEASYNRCLSGSINIVSSFLALFHEDAIFVQMSDKQVKEKLSDIIIKILEEQHEHNLSSPEYLKDLTYWHEEHSLPERLKDFVTEYWRSR